MEPVDAHKLGGWEHEKSTEEGCCHQSEILLEVSFITGIVQCKKNIHERNIYSEILVNLNCVLFV